VVWFGEMPLEMDAIYDALLMADLFVAIGTSGSVYPAAGFVSEARGHGIRTCEINLDPSDNARQFDEARMGQPPKPSQLGLSRCSREELRSDRNGFTAPGPRHPK
jgi:NAD-dependent SIR2 family protein deacetylase